MKHQCLISTETIAEEGKKYIILENHEINIGEAAFLNMDKEEFVFDIQLSSGRKAEDYDHMFDVDSETQELIGLRAKKQR